MRALIEDVGQLAKALAFVAKAAPTRTTIPILECMRIVVEGDRLKLAATDLDLEHRAIVEVADSVDGTAVVPADRLARLVSALPPDARVELVLDDRALRIQSGRGRWRLPSLSEQDFPPPLTVGADAISFTLSAADARALCDRLRYAVSDEETRYYLNGVSVQEQHGRLACAATDGHRLAEVTLEVDPGRDLNMIVPARAIETLKMLAGIGDVEVAIDAAKISLVAGPWVAVSKLVDATFPDYKRVIPSTSENRVTVPRPDLLAALQRLKGVSVGDSKREATAVGLAWDDHKSDVAVCLPRDAANVETLEGSAMSGAAAVAVKLDYLVETLEAFDCPTVCFDHGGPGSPLIITEPDDPLEPAFALIMPMAVPEWRREEPPTTKTADVRKFKAKPRAGARAQRPKPGDAA